MRWVVAASLIVPFGWSRVQAERAIPDGLDVPVITISKSISLTTAETNTIVSAAQNAGAKGYPARYATFPMTAY